jgi:hypothetical protein
LNLRDGALLDMIHAQGQFESMKMKEAEMRALIRESHLQPIRIHLDDGKSYTVSHPDFALVAEGALILAAGPGIDLGDARFTICYFDHITRVEIKQKKSRAAA